MQSRGHTDQATTAVFVGNLSYATTEDSLYTFFGRMGEVENVRLLMDSATQRPKGTCVVKYRNAAAAESAILEYQGVTLDGRPLHVRPFYTNGPPPRDAPHQQQYTTSQGSRRGQNAEPCNEPSIFVGNLSYNTTDETLSAFFGRIGVITRLHRQVYADTQKPKGSCVITFQDAATAQLAIQECQGASLDGRELSLRPYYTNPPPARADHEGYRRPPRSESTGSTITVNVGNLPFTATWRDLKDTFNRVGRVVRADTMRGTGTVSFATMEEAMTAVKELNGAELGGRAMSLRVVR